MNTQTKRTHKQHYIPNRFNDLKWIQNPVTNHKVEQLLRAVLYAGEALYEIPVLAVCAQNAQVQTEQKDLDVLKVGTADAQGWRLAPETNSWLIRNSIKPNAFLLLLNQVQIEGVPAVVERDGNLYCVYNALLTAAYEALFSTHTVNSQYNQYVKEHGIPKHFTVQNKYYDPNKLHEVA